MKTIERTDELAMSASFNGPAIHLESIQGYSISAFWTETVAALEGELTIQGTNNGFLRGHVSNEEDPDAVWDDIPGSLVMVDGTGSFFWNIGETYYKAARVVWTRTSGSGLFTAYIYGKGWV